MIHHIEFHGLLHVRRLLPGLPDHVQEKWKEPQYRYCSVYAISNCGKVCTTFNQFITDFFEKLHISGVVIILPNVCCQPWSCHRLYPTTYSHFQRCSKTKDISEMEAVQPMSPKICLSSLLTRFYQRKWMKSMSGFMHSGSDFRTRRPIVHL